TLRTLFVAERPSPPAGERILKSRHPNKTGDPFPLNGRCSEIAKIIPPRPVSSDSRIREQFNVLPRRRHHGERNGPSARRLSSLFVVRCTLREIAGFSVG